MPDFDYDSERSVRTSNPSENGEHTEQTFEKEVQPVKKSIIDSNSTSEETNPTSTPQIGDDEQIDWN